jgi:hypothetical protein
MKGIIEFFQNSATKTIAVVAFFTIVFVVISCSWFIEFSSFSVGLAKGVLGIFLYWIIDKYAVKEIDTIAELKKGNIAYGLFTLGIAIIVAAAILGS